MPGGDLTFMRKRLDPETRYGLRLSLAALAVILVAVPFSTLVFEVLDKGALTRLDGRLANRLNASVHGSPGLVDGLQAVSWIGRPLFLACVVVAAGIYLWWRGRRRLAVFLVVTAISGALVNTAVKLLVDRPRPVVDHPVATALGNSFPSGHAMASTITYGALVLAFLPLLSRRRRRVAAAGAVVVVLAVGCSRLLLGVHFLTDVIGGYVLGLAWLLAATAIFEIWRTEEKQAVSGTDARPSRRERTPSA